MSRGKSGRATVEEILGVDPGGTFACTVCGHTGPIRYANGRAAFTTGGLCIYCYSRRRTGRHIPVQEAESAGQQITSLRLSTAAAPDPRQAIDWWRRIVSTALTTGLHCKIDAIVDEKHTQDYITLTVIFTNRYGEKVTRPQLEAEIAQTVHDERRWAARKPRRTA